MSPGRYVVLCYRRVENTELSTGHLLLSYEDGPTNMTTNELLEQFESLSFKDMMNLFSVWLQEHRDCTAVMQRVDRAGLVPVVLGEITTRLLREDPVSAIRAMDVSETRIDLRVERASPTPIEKPVVTPVFRAGHDHLAHIFGYRLYAKLRPLPNTTNDKIVECPGCGHWSTLRDPKRFRCEKVCMLDIPVEETTDNWATFCVLELLNLPLPRYFFPREWNPSPPWVSQEDLVKRFKDFEGEMEHIKKELKT